MKFFLALVILASIYVLFIKKNPNQQAGSVDPGSSPRLNAAQAQNRTGAQPAPSPAATQSNSNAIKRPLDRARAVSEQVQKSREAF